MPGLLNHLTGTLDEIDALKEMPENLLKTIKMPRKLGEITERLPEAQYDKQPSLKRNNSMPAIKESRSGDKPPTAESVKRPKLETRSNGSLDREKSPGLSYSNSPNTESKPASLIRKAHEHLGLSNKPKQANLVSIASRAQRNLDLPIIEEKRGENGEDQTGMSNKNKLRLDSALSRVAKLHSKDPYSIASKKSVAL